MPSRPPPRSSPWPRPPLQPLPPPRPACSRPPPWLAPRHGASPPRRRRPPPPTSLWRRPWPLRRAAVPCERPPPSSRASRGGCRAKTRRSARGSRSCPLSWRRRSADRTRHSAHGVCPGSPSPCRHRSCTRRRSHAGRSSRGLQTRRWWNRTFGRKTRQCCTPRRHRRRWNTRPGHSTHPRPSSRSSRPSAAASRRPWTRSRGRRRGRPHPRRRRARRGQLTWKT
mmetsp:Transcript_93901/g.265264  ORF Transcript_93901/g.265264 Transcript_93901/m.265264 type:complete len:225 (-) Transcript_93901:97-771(-)